MKVALLVPTTVQRVRTGVGRVLRPITVRHIKIGPLLIASALERDGHKVQVIDAEARELGERGLLRELSSFNPDLLGIHANLMSFRYASKSAQVIKRVRPQLPIVIGGPAVTSLPEAVMAHHCFDFGVIGEGERTIEELVGAIGSGAGLEDVSGIVFRDGNEIVRTGPRKLEPNLDALPMPAWHHVNFELYRDVILGKRRFANVLCNRGCPYHCVFCDPKGKLGHAPRLRSVESIVNELAYLKGRFGVQSIYFNDDTFTLNRAQILALCERLLLDNVSVQWSCRTRVNLVDYELLSAMKKAGCGRIDFGVESGDDEVLRALRKEITVEQTRKAFEACKKVGIDTLAFFMVGGPYETRQTAERTIRLAWKIAPTFVAAAECRIFPPGTELARLARKQNLVEDDHWERCIIERLGELAPAFNTPRMSRRLIRSYQARLHLLNLLWPIRHPVEMMRRRPLANLRMRLRIDMQILMMALARRRVMI